MPYTHDEAYSRFKLWYVTKDGVEGKYYGNEIDPATPPLEGGEPIILPLSAALGYADCMEFERAHREDYEAAILYMRTPWPPTTWVDVAYFQRGLLVKHHEVSLALPLRHARAELIEGSLCINQFLEDINLIA